MSKHDDETHYEAREEQDSGSWALRSPLSTLAALIALARRRQERRHAQEIGARVRLSQEVAARASSTAGAPRARRTLSWTWQILGILVGTATSISIIKNGFAIDLYGLPAKVLARYTWLRNTLFVPVAWVVRYYFRIEMAWWAKDMIMAYALLTAAHSRAKTFVIPRWYDWSSIHSRWAILVWPRITWLLVHRWERYRGYRKYLARYFPYDLAQPPPLPGERTLGERHLRLEVFEAERDLADASHHLRQIGLQLLLISLATIAFFVWNYLSGVFGPT